MAESIKGCFRTITQLPRTDVYVPSYPQMMLSALHVASNMLAEISAGIWRLTSYFQLIIMLALLYFLLYAVTWLIIGLE